MILPDKKRRSLVDTPLRTIRHTRSTSDAGIRDMIALFFYYNISQSVCLAENRMDTKVKIFDLRIVDTENDINFPRVARIHIGKVRLLFKNRVNPLSLLLAGNRMCLPRQADHFFVIDLILTKEVSRFARNTVDTLYYTRKLKEAGVGVIFTIDNIDTRDTDGELRLTIMASLAQEESRKTSERVKWGQKRRMELGVVFGRDLLGYTVKNGVLSINEEEVPVVKAIFHKYTNESKGTHVIARELLEEGLRPKRIQQWSNTVILRALRNEKYVGDLCQKKTYTPDYLTHKKKYNCGQEEKVYIFVEIVAEIGV